MGLRPDRNNDAFLSCILFLIGIMMHFYHAFSIISAQICFKTL